MALFDIDRLRDALKSQLDTTFYPGYPNTGIDDTRKDFAEALATCVVNELRNDFNVTPIWKDFPGPLPLSLGFSSNGGTLVLFAAGSGFVTTAANVAGMNVIVDGGAQATSRVFCNEANSHRAFVPVVVIVTQLPAGAHTMQLTAYSDAVTTSTDSNDFFTAAVLELPV